MPKFEPARWYGIVAAFIAIVAYYIDIPAELYAGLAAAVFIGGAEVVRSQVTPTAKIEDSGDDGRDV